MGHLGCDCKSEAVTTWSDFLREARRVMRRAPTIAHPSHLLRQLHERIVRATAKRGPNIAALHPLALSKYARPQGFQCGHFSKQGVVLFEDALCCHSPLPLILSLSRELRPLRLSYWLVTQATCWRRAKLSAKPRTSEAMSDFPRGRK